MYKGIINKTVRSNKSTINIKRKWNKRYKQNKDLILKKDVQYQYIIRCYKDVQYQLITVTPLKTTTSIEWISTLPL
jgi:hypothetical protein